MLTQSLWLDLQPGGISPDLHLKEKSNSVTVRLILKSDSALSNKTGIIKGILPNGSDLFLSTFLAYVNGILCADLRFENISAMSTVPGKYKCTLTIINTSQSVTRANYMDHDFLTVLPFTVIVHEKA